MNTLNKALLISAMAVAVAGFATASQAEEKTMEKEKCYGVAKMGKNDCKGGAVACSGHSTKDGEGFVVVPKGLCDRLIGGSTTEPVGK